MRDIFMEQEAADFPTTWLSPVIKSQNLKSDSSPFEVTQSPEYWQRYRSLAGSPFESSDSDSSSDCDDSDDALSLGSPDPSSTILEAPSSKDVSFVSEGLKTLDIFESNALGLVFMTKEDVFATEAVATLAQQAEGLQAPRYHQDDRSCGRPDQKHNAQFPQDIGLWADVGDSSGPKPDPYECNLRAPRMKSIALPEEQEYDDEDLLYSGPDLGGWLTGTLDGVPKAMLSGLSCLDIGLPMPFAMEV